MVLGWRRVQSSRCESGALDISREGKVLARRVAAGLIEGRAQTSLSAAIRGLWDPMASSGCR